MSHAECLDAAIVHSRDNGFDYFGFKTLERSYLLRIEGLIVERPQVSHLHKIRNIFTHLNVLQHLLMRVAVGIHKVQHSPQNFDLSSFRACFILRATWRPMIS